MVFLASEFFVVSSDYFGGLLANVINHIMLKNSAGMPIFTAPFVVSTWCVLLELKITGLESAIEHFSTYDITSNGIGNFYTVIRSVGQVMFQGYWLSGFIFIAALLVNSYKVSTWAVIGSGVGMLIARALG